MFLKKFIQKKIFKQQNDIVIPQERELSGCNIAILATDGFEQVELFSPRDALIEAGARIFIIAPKSGKIRGWYFDRWGKSINVDLTVKEAMKENFDFLVIPGGVLNPDQLRMNPDVIEFVRGFMESGKTVASICHGPQVLIETGLLDHITLTSYPSIKTDLKNAGANWVNQEVVIDQGLITSRNPDDLRAFNNTIIREFAYRRHHPPLPNTEGYVVTM
jgi:protease I